ncbi:hypothetical protein CROQUDRAFT_97797 [Cronartium quercuum f. sp. fusiforme G11]|uniref:Uncharacterized protein n=1 Tax=Cronartium quercuum f. sp. fusiforme G11 TaxID=708437 RepID=A0A9P6T838_9BASI|nr:hypothetical protein CROQUDRAFT_97797 [Cronartium quercuum f. sp. fusiforme G11]
MAWKEAQDNKLTEGMDIGNYLWKMDMKAMDLEHAGFKWMKDSILGRWYQLGIPLGYANVSTVLNARLRAQPNQPVSAHKVEEAIQAKNQEHGNPGSDARKLSAPNVESDDPDELPLCPPLTEHRHLPTYAIDINESKFTVEVLPDSNAATKEDMLPEGVWASKSNLMEAWDNLDEGADTSVSSNQGT